MNDVKLIWITPNAQAVTAYCGRVSNPANQDNHETADKLLRYLQKNTHWSPFEMASMCLEIVTPRDVARQILRHRSFSFQEFSQRYAVVDTFTTRECRLQDDKNRQNSIPVQDRELARFWQEQQMDVLSVAKQAYNNALNAGIAKEVARSVLPEGLSMSRMYVSGTIRSWLHYCEVRTDASTQKEHRDIADKCQVILKREMPALFE